MMARICIAIGLVLGLVSINYAIYGKERIVREGMTIYLELAPVDPRSLMQGDYMALRFALAGEISHAGEQAQQEKRGTFFAQIRIDENLVAKLDPKSPLRLRYRWRDNQVWLGTNAFFFEEGTVERYNNARFGEFRLDPETGEAVLVDLVNQPRGRPSDS